MMFRPLFPAGILALTCFCLPVSAQQAVLYEKPSAFNSTVLVTEADGLRTLRFERGGARQSVVKMGDPDHLELPYARAAFTGLALCGGKGPGRALIVGLGGGTLPMFLRKHYPEAEIEAVDIDPDVVAVAKGYFGFQEDARMRGVVADGRQFVEQAAKPYDIVFLDAFGSDSVPAHLTTREFLQAVRKALQPSGVVVGNIWSRHSNPLYDAMVRTYQEVFDELYILEVEGTGNRILLALPRKESLTRDALAEKAGKVSAAGQFRYDLGEIVRKGFEHPAVKDPNVEVLTDGKR